MGSGGGIGRRHRCRRSCHFNSEKGSEGGSIMSTKESCPNCGKMTIMKGLEKDIFVSQVCEHCGFDLEALAKVLPQLEKEKPELKTKEMLPK
jgi:ribosomal protein L37AE/L43A